MNEVDLDPERSPISMGVRTLGERRWLVEDDNAEELLELKAQLCVEQHDEVFATEPGTEQAGEQVVDLLRAHGVTVSGDEGLHPLDRAGRSVPEDLVLMKRGSNGWHLATGSVCFPARWRLIDKLGRHITAVHAPVRGYSERLATKVDGLFDRLGDQPVWRRNWFIHADASLFQLGPPAGGDRLVPRETALREIVVRSERQTLRRLEPSSDWILFTIATQQADVGTFASTNDRRDALVRYLRAAEPAVLSHRGVSRQQVAELLSALDAH